MSKIKFKLPWDGTDVPQEEKYEVNNEPSLTVPGESMTIKEIMARAMAGTEPEQGDAQYFDVDDVSHINEFFRQGLDLTDIDKLNARATELIGEIEEAKKRKEEAESEPEPESEPESNDGGET